MAAGVVIGAYGAVCANEQVGPLLDTCASRYESLRCLVGESQRRHRHTATGRDGLWHGRGSALDANGRNVQVTRSSPEVQVE